MVYADFIGFYLYPEGPLFFTANDMSRSEMKVHDVNKVSSQVSNSGKTAKALALISVHQLHIARTVLVVLNKT